MITQVYFPEKDSSGQFNRVGNLPSVKALGGKIIFKEGLNIIIGPNGIGKSSIVEAIANHLAANELGMSTISNTWIMDNVGFSNTVTKCAEVDHDGNQIYFADPKRKTGTRCGQANEEFFAISALESCASSTESSGEQTERRVADFISLLDNDIERKPICFFSRQSEAAATRSRELTQAIEEHFKARIPEGQITVIMDEPDDDLGLLSEIILWNNLKKHANNNKYQLIIVTHSSESINIEGAHYIDLKSGYLDACRRAKNGDVVDLESKRLSFSFDLELTSYQASVLKKIHNQGTALVLKSRSAHLDELEREGVLTSHVIKRPICNKKTSRNRPRLGFSKAESDVAYQLTPKGSNYVCEILLN